MREGVEEKMRFHQTVLDLKERYLDRTPPELVRRAATEFLGQPPESLREVPRQWTPGGGSQNFLIRAGSVQYFLKAKHKSLLVESALESEPGFSQTPSLENEYNFLTTLAPSPHVPVVAGFAQHGDWLFLATEALRPFDALREFSPPQMVDAFAQLSNFVRGLYEKGIVHTDIHEKNVCFRGLTPVLIDFEEARHFPQAVPFEQSLDMVGVCGGDHVGDFPVLEKGAVPGPTCLARLKKVFASALRPGLPAYLAQCNFDCTSGYNLDVEQQPDERIYQSVILHDMTIAGQRPVEDARLVQVRHALEYAHSVLGRPLDVVDLGSNMGMVSFFCGDFPHTRRVTGLEADARYVEAARVLAFYSDRPSGVDFVRYMTGSAPYAWATDVLLMLSVYHHVADKDAFLDELSTREITCILGEFATQERYYPQRGSVAAEIEHIRKTLGFRHAEYIALSADYQRPLVAFHNGDVRAFRTLAAAGSVRKAGITPGGAESRRALAWVRAHSPQGQGVSVSNRQPTPYPEVTGYFIPTLLQWGEKDLAVRYARWLMSIQNADGSFSGPGIASPFAFDTGQIIRGLAAITPLLPEAARPLERACRWIMDTASPEGRLALPEDMGAWSLGARGHVNEAIHLYVLPGLLAAGKALNTGGFDAFVRKSLAWYIAHCNLTNFLAPNMLLHFYCYIQEALFDLGAVDICRQGMRELAERQAENGMVPAYANAAWICTPGLIQAGLVWLKLGDRAHALPALRCAQSLQTAAGGFPGSVGEGADYFPGEELSWPVKFWLDAMTWLSPDEKMPAHTAGAGVAAGTENVRAENIREEDVPLVALAGAAASRLEEDARSLMSCPADTPCMEQAARLVPVLLDRGRRQEALDLAKWLAKNFSSAQGKNLFLTAGLLRVFRQPEVLAAHGDGHLKQLCATVLPLQRRSAEQEPGLFCCFGELHQAGQALDHDAWTDCARHWASRQSTLADQRAGEALVREAAAVGLLQKPENGLALLARMAESMGAEIPADPEPRAKYAEIALWLAWGAWSLGDDVIGGAAYCLGMGALGNGRRQWPKNVFQGGASAALAFASAVSAMQRCRFVRFFPQFLDDIADDDGRLAFVRQSLQGREQARVLDMGTGKGRYLRRLHYGGFANLTGQDVHPAFARFMPKRVSARVGTVLRSGWDDGSFDAVLLCEVLEHCVDLHAALGEMRRILADGGTLVIVDKNVQRLASWPGGIPPWEQWFDCRELARILAGSGFEVTALDPDLGYENRRDGLFFGLAARKRSAV